MAFEVRGLRESIHRSSGFHSRFDIQYYLFESLFTEMEALFSLVLGWQKYFLSNYKGVCIGATKTLNKEQNGANKKQNWGKRTQIKRFRGIVFHENMYL